MSPPLTHPSKRASTFLVGKRAACVCLQHRCEALPGCSHTAAHPANKRSYSSSVFRPLLATKIVTPPACMHAAPVKCLSADVLCAAFCLASLFDRSITVCSHLQPGAEKALGAAPLTAFLTSPLCVCARAIRCNAHVGYSQDRASYVASAHSAARPNLQRGAAVLQGWCVSLRVLPLTAPVQQTPLHERPVQVARWAPSWCAHQDAQAHDAQSGSHCLDQQPEPLRVVKPEMGSVHQSCTCNFIAAHWKLHVL